MSVAIISGTNRPGNLSKRVAKVYQELLSTEGIPSEVFSLEDLPREIAFGDLYGRRTETFSAVQQMVEATRTFVFIVPEYNGSVPGILKIFIDALDYPASFDNKRAALVGISAGETGNERGLDHLDDILSFLGTQVLPNRVRISRVRQKMDRSGALLDDRAREKLRIQVRDLRTFFAPDL